MSVIGIDPSINFIGWAIAEDGNLLESGLIKTKGKTDGEKLYYLFNELVKIITNTNVKKAYIDTTIYKGKNHSIQKIFVFAKSIGLLEFFFEYYKIPLKASSRKLARKEVAIMKARDILLDNFEYTVKRLDKLTTHEAEAVVIACWHSREM